MKKELAKKGYELAQKEFKKKQIEKVKEIVMKTLEKLEDLKKQKKEIEEKIRILKMDIEDLKQGRFDRILERQEKDKKAKEISVVKIEKRDNDYSFDVSYYYPSTTWAITSNVSDTSITLDPYIAKTYTVGTYKVGDKIIHLR